MTDEAMKDLVNKHDAVIGSMISSIEHLVDAQKESNSRQDATNQRLEEISKYLAKQVAFSSKLEMMDKEIADSFKRRDEAKRESDKRLHARIDEIELIQKSENGCNSLRLLTKDLEALSREITRLVAHDELRAEIVENIDKKVDKYPSGKTLLSVAAMFIGPVLLFGAYIVQSISKTDAALSKMSTTLERDVVDTNRLMQLIYDGKTVHVDKQGR